MTQELMYVHACEHIIYIELQHSSDLLLWGEKKKKKKRGKKKKSSVQRHPAILLSKSGRSFAQGNLAPVETLKHEVEAVALNLTDTRASRRNWTDRTQLVHLWWQSVEVLTPGSPVISPSSNKHTHPALPTHPLLHFSRLNHFTLIFPLWKSCYFPLFFWQPTLARALVISDAASLEISALTQGKDAHLYCRHLIFFFYYS